MFNPENRISFMNRLIVIWIYLGYNFETLVSDRYTPYRDSVVEREFIFQQFFGVKYFSQNIFLQCENGWSLWLNFLSCRLWGGQRKIEFTLVAKYVLSFDEPLSDIRWTQFFKTATNIRPNDYRFAESKINMVYY